MADQQVFHCKVCETTALSKPGICAKCCGRLGVVAMPPPTRKPRPCMRCNGMKFVRIIPREMTMVQRDDVFYEQVAPMALTYAITSDRDRSRKLTNLLGGLGQLETYVCKGCNYVEWYAQGVVDDIPIGPEYMSEEIDLTGEAPYR